MMKPVTRINEDRLAVLEQRIEYLNDRIESGVTKHISFDRREIAALEWAVKILRRYLKINERRFARMNTLTREGSVDRSERIHQ